MIVPHRASALGLTRRRFLSALGASVASALVVERAVAQQVGDTTQVQSAASNVVMDQEAAQTVRRPPKPGAKPVLSNDERDAAEHKIKCQCGCTLDVYTCRTTDFACSVSPAMHRDVMRLVAGGYTADEIIAAFVDTYGEKVLMEPKREGFNWAGYIAPFAALGTGAVVLGVLIRRWGIRAAATPRLATAGYRGVDASADELARLEAAVRNEDG